MKIKLLAASVLFLALGIHTAEAQNRQKTSVQKERVQKNRKGDLVKPGKRGNVKKYGDYRKANRKFRSDKVMKNRHRKDIRKHRKHNGRPAFHKRYRRSHRS